ncbi:hypothetical protein OKJ48_06260 [Streptomyces kunmingensis]|uniref:Uncharacterized protein n=1 Tax=Streptomyces kunmingensis TaxID=68225 RepID=A0ABU6C7N1_9ACTN|nr:hypothetical protein [Streptomyces kunmingensis]MEB3959855.1 hypothetical protein [Streptomyces kunmingensis]
MSDEEWERFLRESEEGVPDAPKEPSARARIVTRRLQEEARPPEGWRTHTPPRRRNRLWYVVGLLIALALLVVALDRNLIPGWSDGDGDGDGDDTSQGEQATVSQPFRGSPAVHWADGVAGIEVPAAQATGWMNKTEVARALAKTRDFLVASSLDPEVLRGGRPDKALAYINPDQPDELKNLDTALSTPSEKHNPLTMFSRFDTSQVRLVGDVVKTRGLLSYRESDKGAVEVTADVTYVYAVTPAESGSDDVARTIVRRETVVNWDDPAKIVTKAGTFSVVRNSLDTTNAGCDDSYTGFFRPKFEAGQRADGPAVDPYDRDTPMEERMRESEGQECGVATRS